MSGSFIEYLKENKYEEFSRKALSFCIYHRDIFEDIFSGQRVGYISIEDISFISVNIEDFPGDRIAFDVLIDPEVDCQLILPGDDRETQSTNKVWLLCSCAATIGSKLSDFRIGYVQEYTGKNKSEKPLNGDMVPIIKRADYESVAEEMISKYYPEALQTPMKIDPSAFAAKMGLSVVDRRITKNGSIFGQFYFEGCRTKFFDPIAKTFYEEDVKKNTIVIDSTTAFVYSYGSEDITIAHECVHAFLHRKAFYFAKLANKELSHISCEKSGGIAGGEDNKTLSWIESQATGIAPFLLMPSKTFRTKADELIQYYSSCCENDGVVYIGQVIRELSQFFGVTIYAARKRLIDLGYHDATGSLNWVDGRYVPAYTFKKGSLRENETFTVSFKDSFKAIVHDSNLIEHLSDGKYVFVENHLVLDDPKYISASREGASLTDYARHHLDECAVKFLISQSGEGQLSHELGTSCYLCREIGSGFRYSIKVSDDNKGLLDSEKTKEAFQSYSKEVKDLNALIGGKTLPEALVAIRDYYGMSFKEIAIDSGLDERTIGRYFRGETKRVEKDSIIAICHGLKLYPMVSEKILRLAGVQLRENDPRDDALMAVLLYMKDYEIEAVNECLQKSGFAPLSKEKL